LEDTTFLLGQFWLILRGTIAVGFGEGDMPDMDLPAREASYPAELECFLPLFKKNLLP